MASAWPLSLQQKLEVAGFTYTPGNTRVASENDIGPAKIRSRFTDGVDKYQCQITLDFDDMSTFKTFYKTTLGNGSLPFTFNDPFTQTSAIFRFTPSQDPSITPLGSGGRKFVLRMEWEKVG